MPNPQIPALISATELLRTTHRNDVKVFDVRGAWSDSPGDARQQYLDGHIDGASFLDWKKFFVAAGYPLNLAPVCNVSEAAAAFHKLGIDDGDTVVLYDNYHHMTASRVWWAMRYWGFSRVKVLNGGWSYWEKSGLPVSQEPQLPPAGNFQPVENPSLRVDLFDVQNRSGDVYLIDARGAASFVKTEGDEKTGHIPGAVNIPFRDLLEADTGLFKPISELNALFDAVLPDFKNRSVISSCGSGYAATPVILALELLGVEAQLYDGSFAEWRQDPDRPIEG